VKKLRYASDALANLWGKRGKKSLGHLEALQESLGALNDLAVAGRLMHALAESHPETAFCAGHAVGLLSAEAKEHTGSKRRIARELDAIRFWRKSYGQNAAGAGVTWSGPNRHRFRFDSATLPRTITSNVALRRL